MKSNNAPLIVAVFLVLGGLTLGSLFSAKTGTLEVRSAYGGPILVETAQAQDALPAVASADMDILTETSLPASPDFNNVSLPDYTTGAAKDPGFLVGQVAASATSSGKKN